MQTFLGILLGGSFLAFLQFLITRYDNKHDKFDEINNRFSEFEKTLGDIVAAIKKLDDKGDEREAVNKRVRILHFEDELQEGKSHSKDSFDQVLSDISGYNAYCDRHPEFKNEQTAATVEHIRQVYRERLEKHDFL